MLAFYLSQTLSLTWTRESKARLALLFIQPMLWSLRKRREHYHDQRRGDSWSEELPVLRMTTPEFEKMRDEYDFSSARGVQETQRHAAGSSPSLNFNLEDQSKDPIEKEAERLSWKCDKIKQKMILKTQSLLIERGYEIPDEKDIERVINIVMAEHEAIDIDQRSKRFQNLYYRLGKKGDKFWMELLESLADYDINKIDCDSDD